MTSESVETALLSTLYSFVLKLRKSRRGVVEETRIRNYRIFELAQKQKFFFSWKLELYVVSSLLRCPNCAPIWIRRYATFLFTICVPFSSIKNAIFKSSHFCNAITKQAFNLLFPPYLMKKLSNVKAMRLQLLSETKFLYLAENVLFDFEFLISLFFGFFFTILLS